MKKLLNFGITCLGILTTIPTFAQIKNSEENSVLNLYNASANSFEFSGGETSVQVRVATISTVRNPVKDKDRISSIKYHRIFLKAGITNTKKFIDIDKFDFKENNGLAFGLIYKYSFDDIFLKENGDTYNMKTVEAGINYSYDKFKFYNSDTENISTETPGNVSLNAGLNQYFFKLNRNFIWAFALNATYNIRTYNKDKLINFAELDNGTVFNNNILAIKNFSGKTGNLIDDASSGEISLSIPFIPEYEIKNVPIIVPVPHIGYEFFSYEKPKMTAGLAVGFLAKNLFSKASPNAKFNQQLTRKFNNPSFLNIGIDWSVQDGISSKPNYFITGGIKF